MKMKLSCFGSTKDIDDIAKAGYDCAELQIREIVELSDDEYKMALKRVKDSGITCEVFDNPVPLNISITSPEFDLNYWTEYLKKGAERTAKMGARYYVFGNGRSRSLPAEGDVKGAYEKLITFINILCDVTAEYNITVLLEPLSTSLSNFINSIPEAVKFIEEFGRYNLKTMCDMRYLLPMNRDVEDIANYEKYIKHIHVDNPLSNFPQRFIPTLNDGYDYAPFINVLKKICYKEIISIEANTFNDFKEDIKKGIEFFKHFGIEAYRS
ncbi:sugar phosphate isomerase/epimerase family protein [Thermovenabulum sp.]|uniref:sugar phosphate isomerase/epimerase family protein n=1 Tax=Thermovenabulum sp. TaxID=3100335 RepID=UPI003C7DE8D1